MKVQNASSGSRGLGEIASKPIRNAKCSLITVSNKFHDLRSFRGLSSVNDPMQYQKIWLIAISINISLLTLRFGEGEALEIEGFIAQLL